MDLVERFSGQMQAYNLSEEESAMMGAVKGLLSKGAYTELFTIDTHLLRLDEVRKKLSLISASEFRTGLFNWSLRQNIEDLRAMILQLKNLRSFMFGRLT